MYTVKEVSARTGISVRALHYYDEIGLLKPAEKSDAGYRLYDDGDLERLQEILFFRELDLPLKEIKRLLANGAGKSDRMLTLKLQRGMFLTRKYRLERLIAQIDGILKGENPMDFTVFQKTELDEMFDAMLNHMPEEMRERAASEFGGVDRWRERYIEAYSHPEMQEKLLRLVGAYGGKESYLSAVENPLSEEIMEGYKARLERVMQRLAEKKGEPVDSFAVKELVGEYGFIQKMVCQMEDETMLMVAQARIWRQAEHAAKTDAVYGEGTAAFFADAVEAFYGKE